MVAGCWWPAPTPPDVVELWDWTLGPATSTSARPTRRAPRNCAGPAGHDHGRGRRPVGHPRCRRRGRVPRRRGALLRQSGHRSRRGSPWPSSSRAWGPDARRRLPMPDLGMLEEFLAGASVDAAVFALRPDYRAMLLAVDGLVPGPSDQDERRAAPGGGDRGPRGAERPAGGPAAPRGGVAGGLPGVRGQAATHPQQPGGAAAPCGVRAAPGEPAHRPLQRGLGAAPDPARRGGPDPLRRCAAAGPRHRRRSPSTPWPTAPR